MSSITKYKIPCTTENKSHVVWSVDVPTSCPLSNGHVINSSGIEILDRMDQDEYQLDVVRIFENNQNTQGKFRSESFRYSMPAGTSQQTIQFMSNISVLAVKLNTRDEQIGDSFNVCVIPAPVLGSVVQDASAGSNVVHVSPSLIQYAHRGYVLSTGQGVILGEIKRVYTDRVELQTPITQALTSGTPLTLRVLFIKNFQIDAATNVSIGDSKIGATALPEAAWINITYNNNSQVAKDLVFSIEYLY